MIENAFPGPYHASNIKGLLWCQRKEYFRSVVGERPAYRNFNAVWGTAVHAAIVMWNSSKRPVMESLIARSFVSELFGIEETTPVRDKDIGIPIWYPTADHLADLNDAADEFGTMFHEYTRHEFATGDFKILAGEAEFSFKRYFDFEGRIDEVRRYADGRIVIVDFKTGKMDSSIQQFELDNNIQFLLYASALYRGGIAGLERLAGTVPEYVQFNLRDLQPYQKWTGCRGGGDITQSYIEWAEQNCIVNEKTDKPGFPAGSHRGPGAHWSRPSVGKLESFIRLLPDYVHAFRVGRYIPNFGTMTCGQCGFKADCDALSEGLSRAETTAVANAITESGVEPEKLFAE